MEKFGLNANCSVFNDRIDEFLWAMAQAESLSIAAGKIFETDSENFTGERSKKHVLSLLLADIEAKLGKLTLEAELITAAMKDSRHNPLLHSAANFK